MASIRYRLCGSGGYSIYLGIKDERILIKNFSLDVLKGSSTHLYGNIFRYTVWMDIYEDRYGCYGMFDGYDIYDLAME